MFTLNHESYEIQYLLHCYLLLMTEEDRVYLYGQEVATFYSDLFPGYPEGFKMAKDLAKFVSTLYFKVLNCNFNQCIKPGYTLY